MTETFTTANVLLSTLQNEYLTSEAAKLNAEVEKLLEETRSREKYSLAIIAGVAVWVFTNLNSRNIGLLQLVSFIPLVTTLFYGISVKYLYDNIKWIGRYLRRIEDHFLNNAQDIKGAYWGWEKYFDSENKKIKFVRVTWGIWILQLLLAITLFVLVSVKHDFIIAVQAVNSPH